MQTASSRGKAPGGTAAADRLREERIRFDDDRNELALQLHDAQQRSKLSTQLAETAQAALETEKKQNLALVQELEASFAAERGTWRADITEKEKINAQQRSEITKLEEKLGTFVSRSAQQAQIMIGLEQELANTANLLINQQVCAPMSIDGQHRSAG